MPSEQGIKETEELAKKISKRKFIAVYTNSANRSKIPARIISKRNIYRPKVIIDRDIDPMKVDYEGRDIVEHVKNAKQRSRTGERWMDGELPSIEPLADFMARNFRFFMKLISRYCSRNGEVLVVTHWETFAAAESAFKKISFRKSCMAHETFLYNKLYEFKV